MTNTTTIRIYPDNLIANAVDVDPSALASEFIAMAVAGCDMGGRPSMEFAYRWWISGPEGRSASWDDADWDALADALAAELAKQPEVRAQLWKRIGG